MSKKVEAAARLLATEAEYLHACDWRPLAFLRGKIAWVGAGNPDSRYTQEDAIRLQKARDKWPNVKE